MHIKDKRLTAFSVVKMLLEANQEILREYPYRVLKPYSNKIELE